MSGDGTSEHPPSAHSKRPRMALGVPWSALLAFARAAVVSWLLIAAACYLVASLLGADACESDPQGGVNRQAPPAKKLLPLRT